MVSSDAKRRVLVLCTGNSCRSQMAEGLINHFLGDWQAFSAGTRPAGYVHPLAVQALAEIGIQHQGVSKSVEAFRGQVFDAVITVCDDAAEDCPVWLGPGLKTHFSYRDPAKAPGGPAEQMAVFRQVRDDIRAQILPYLQSLPTGEAAPGTGA